MSALVSAIGAAPDLRGFLDDVRGDIPEMWCEGQETEILVQLMLSVWRHGSEQFRDMCVLNIDIDESTVRSWRRRESEPSWSHGRAVKRAAAYRLNEDRARVALLGLGAS